MKRMKKILAMLLAVVMVMGLSVTAFAAKESGSITVSGLSTANEQTVKIYEIYRLDGNDNSWVKADWATAITTEADLKNSEKLKTLAGQVPESAIQTEKTAAGSGTVIFNNLQAGAYLVIATDSANNVTYNPMVAVTYGYNETTHLIEGKNAPLVAKAETQQVVKTQDEADDVKDAVVEVGDLIKYTVKVTVPYIKDDTDPTSVSFKVSDTLVGATYYLSGDAVKGVSPVSTIKIGENDVAIPGSNSGAVYDIASYVATDKKSFEIDMTALVSANTEKEIDGETHRIYNNTLAGQEIVITYTAKVDAVDEITNEARTDHMPTSGSTQNKTTAYTGQLTITKRVANVVNEVETYTGALLNGAEFVIYRINESDKKEYAVIANGYITGAWIEEAKEGEVPQGAGKITTGEDGTATVKGLNVGQYYFKETIAPDGYSINTNDAPGEVTKKVTDDVVTVTGEAKMTDTTLASLPSTGGIGTTIFTIGGCAIMVIAAGLFFATRRKAER